MSKPILIILSLIAMAVNTTIAIYVQFDPGYSKQDSYKTREYYPALIVDKRTYETCSKSSCTTHCSFNLELDDGTLNKNIYVTSEVCQNYNMGQMISLERHITDPQVVRNSIIRSITVGIAAVLLILLAVSFFIYVD